MMAERRVWIVQCLCGPNRHCITGLAGEAGDRLEAEETIEKQLKRYLRRMIGDGIFNPFCGICGAKEAAWHYELGRTRFTSMEEAAPELHKIQDANLLAALIFGGGDPERPN